MMVPDHEVCQELSRGDWFVLYRGRCRKDGSSVLLKMPRSDPVSPFAARLLEHEYELLRGLSLSGVLRVHALLRHDGGCCLVLDDRGGTPLQTLLTTRRFDLQAFFPLALQLVTTLSELHRREIIHNHINPGGILVHTATGEVCFTDLSRGSQLVGETQAPPQPLELRGALVYLSPEQTGRMNRAIDYRTDFYSLGVTFYELLTGSPPFRSADTLGMIHQHIASTPPSPVELDPQIPGPLAQIVMKLLAKTAEERYQSALGLKEDLAHCAHEWAARGQIMPFTLGQRDVPDRFLISQKLYGRAREVATLLGAFDRVCQERAAPASMLLVTGYAGIGKTSLIQELYKPIIRERGYFISGKFDQVVRSVPFGALIQAFRGLVRQLLTESEEQLAAWRAALLKALEAQGGVLTEVIPEIELIIGRQPPPPALGPTEALNRFQRVFQHFVGALARQEHPLVVFLDDLQWADPATLSLLQPLLTGQESQSLLLMGAYRDNDVDANHPLLRTLGQLESAGVQLQGVVLGPLQLPDLTLLLRDTLHSTLQAAEPLARLVLEKTGGNPFFVIQFLKTLQQEGFIEFDYEQCCWTYRLDAIAGAPLTDNVIDLMTRKIQRLSAQTQRALTLAACIGNPFDQSLLAVVSEQSPEATADDLQEAINEGLIRPVARAYYAAEPDAAAAATPHAAYAFLHDRVQQAAYALIPDAGKQPVHLTVGRLLRSLMETDRSEEKLFDIVHHLNRGSSLLCDEHERVELARLNLSAGRKAKSSTAYAAALDYFQAGSSLLTDRHWEGEYDLTFALRFEGAECEYLCGNFDMATAQLEILLQRATSKLDHAKVYSLRMVQYENMSRYADALASAREGLTLFGVSFPDTSHEKQTALDSEIEAIQALRGGRSIEALVTLPVMTDPEMRIVMSMLTDIWSSTYIIGDALLACLMSATMVRLSLLHGNLAESAYGYVTHAITVGPVRGDYQSAYEFGRLALKVNERFHDSRRRAKIYQQFHAHVNLWRQPMHTCIPYAREACRSGLEAGDFLYAAEFERVQAEKEVRRALAEVETLKNRLQEENVYLQGEIRREHNFEEMVGHSQALLEMLQKVELVAPTDSTILLYGETGTGKELVARAVHDRSARVHRPLVKVNCGAISAGLVESELFGHMKGAFTGALERRIGRFELANGGTIFLDEIGELPVETQVKLLRVLQEQEFEPVGSSRTVQVDVRVIAATNRDLEEAVRAGRFRSDLFYRLNVFPIQVPPLRERRSDIPLLVMFFLSRFARKLGKKIEAVPQGIMDLLTAYDWPGNIRELQNLIERAVVLSQGPVLRLDRALLPAVASDAVTMPAETVGDVSAQPERDRPDRIPPTTAVPAEALSLEAVERSHILGVLKQTRGVIEGLKGAARILNLHPNTLRSRIKRLGIKHSDYDIS